MKTDKLAILLTALILVPTGAFAELQEFLIPVDPLEEATQRNKSNRFLQEHGYFASRYRIVRVNTSLLESEEQFTISFFDDVSLTVQVQERDVHPQGYRLSWSGKVVDPPISPKFLEDQGNTPEQAKFMHASMFGITISAIKYDYDEANDQSFPSYTRDSNERASRSSTFYGVGAFFAVSSLPAHYSLRALKNDKRYHVLFEIDQDKIFSPGPIIDLENPELGRRRQQHKDFMDALGENS